MTIQENGCIAKWLYLQICSCLKNIYSSKYNFSLLLEKFEVLKVLNMSFVMVSVSKNWIYTQY